MYMGASNDTSSAVEAAGGLSTLTPQPNTPTANIPAAASNRRAAGGGARNTNGASGGGTAPRSSQFRGVTKHRRSGRWEAHIWVKETGKQVYLGGYEEEQHAAEAYDIAALKCKGDKARTNFNEEKYSELVRYIRDIPMEELVMAVRRQSQGFSRGSSMHRGVTHHPNGRWEARIGMPGSKHIYLGLFHTEATAARAYDRALVRLRGSAAATNFSITDYSDELKAFTEDTQPASW